MAACRADQQGAAASERRTTAGATIWLVRPALSVPTASSRGARSWKCAMNSPIKTDPVSPPERHGDWAWRATAQDAFTHSRIGEFIGRSLLDR